MKGPLSQNSFCQKYCLTKENLKIQWDRLLELKKEDIQDFQRII